MSIVCSIFSQVLRLIPRADFDSAVRKHDAERNAKGFTCWGQLVAMLFCQLGSVNSLRDISNGLAASEGKLRHLGLPAAPKRSTLAYANAHRPSELFEDLFYRMLEVAHSQAQQAGVRHKFRFKNKLLSIDATTIELCASVFDWAQFRRTKGAVKLHLMLDHDGLLPCYGVITDGKQHEVTVTRQWEFAPGTVLVFDRGYTDYNWFERLSRQGVYFVTRLKTNADIIEVEDRPLPRRKGLVRDQVICMTQQAAESDHAAHDAPHRVLRRTAAAHPGFPDQQHEAGCRHRCRDLQEQVADRVILQGPETVMQGQDLRRHLGQRTEDADMDSADLHTAGQNPAHEVDLWVALVQLHGPAAPATVRLSRPVEVDRRSLPGTGDAAPRHNWNWPSRDLDSRNFSTGAEAHNCRSVPGYILDSRQLYA